MNPGQEINVLVTATGGSCCDDLIRAMEAEGWGVEIAGELEQLVSLGRSEAFHLAIVACSDPARLPADPLDALMELRADLPVVFLAGDGGDPAQRSALAGAGWDRIHRLDAPPAELMEVLRSELAAAAAEAPHYAVWCIDDDEQFLGSLRDMLPERLMRAFQRFTLSFEFFSDPVEALAEASETNAGELGVVICDQVMPRMQGIELLKRIKQIHPETHCALLTGHAALDSAVEAINAKVLDKYFFKPIEMPGQFANEIRHLLREHHLRLNCDAQRGRLMAQFRFIRTISAAASADEALAATVRFLHRQVRPDQVVLILKQDAGFVIRQGTGPAGELMEGATVPDNGVFEWVLRRGVPLFVSADRQLPAGLTPPPFISQPFAAWPLAWGNEALGVILACPTAGCASFPRADRMLISFAADIAAMTVSGFADRRALEDHYVGTMASLMDAVEAKDSYTRGHTDRVTELAVALGQAVGVKGSEMEDLRRAAALHDIGKIAIPDRIILKPGRLTSREYSIIKDHCARAEQILKPLRFLGSARRIIRSHHEHYDGTGYPDGLAGDQIPLGARILAVADAYDAMTSTRAYRRAMDPVEALAQIEGGAGAQFDPKLAAEFTRMMSKADDRQPAPAGKGANPDMWE